MLSGPPLGGGANPGLAIDVQRGRISAGSPGGDGGGREDSELVRILVEGGADLDARNDFGDYSLVFRFDSTGADGKKHPPGGGPEPHHPADEGVIALWK